MSDLNERNPDLHDRLLDLALREKLGGESPPDLTERILAAQVEAQLVPAKVEEPKMKTRRYLPAFLKLAVAASLLVGVGWLLYPSVSSDRSVALIDASSQLPTPFYLSDEIQYFPPDDQLSVRLSEETKAKNMTGTVVSKTEGGALGKSAGQQSRPMLATELYVGQRWIKYDDESAPEANMGLQGLVNDANANVGQQITPTQSEAENTEAGGVLSFNVGFTPGRPDGPNAHVSDGKRRELILGVTPRIIIQPKEEQSLGLEITQTEGRGAGLGGKSLAKTVDPNRKDEVLRSINKPIVATRDHIDKLLELGTISPEEAEWSFNHLDELAALRIESEPAEGQDADRGGDQYTRIYENPFIEAIGERATSTFSIDVDTASYANVRQFLTQSGTLPPADAVRIEELINYFDYDYAVPETKDGTPFASHVEVAGCPWNADHRLVRIGIKGREIDNDKRPLSNLVFLIDVSGSMNQPNKLPLVVKGLEELTRELGENDRVAIVVYASSEGLVLDSTPGTEQKTILAALEQLRAGGSTAGGAGIRLAYQLAEDHFIKGGVNRVILCTDGDFNVGTTSTGELERLVQDKAKGTGVFLSVLGFGRGNLNDAMMETISNHGNGNYHYVDNFREARRVLVEEMTGTLVTIAKDVKIQVFFNPAQVAGYRLIGYENRMLKTQDFNDDTKDAGEIGAGHTVTALYEIVPAGGTLKTSLNMPAVDQSPYVAATETPSPNPSPADGRGGIGAKDAEELLTLRMRYKQPDGDKSSLLEWPITDTQEKFGKATGDFKFATAVAGFGMLLRDSQHRGNATWDAMLEIATEGTGKDPSGRRAELVDLIRKAKELAGE